jgi:hypothetical protein
MHNAMGQPMAFFVSPGSDSNVKLWVCCCRDNTYKQHTVYEAEFVKGLGMLERYRSGALFESQ